MKSDIQQQNDAHPKNSPQNYYEAAQFPCQTSPIIWMNFQGALRKTLPW